MDERVEVDGWMPVVEREGLEKRRFVMTLIGLSTYIRISRKTLIKNNTQKTCSGCVDMMPSVLNSRCRGVHP